LINSRPSHSAAAAVVVVIAEVVYNYSIFLCLASFRSFEQQEPFFASNFLDGPSSSISSMVLARQQLLLYLFLNVNLVAPHRLTVRHMLEGRQILSVNVSRCEMLTMMDYCAHFL
jgi:hypothetical protein